MKPAIALFALVSIGLAVEPALSPEVKSLADRATEEFHSGKYREAARDFEQAARLSHESCLRCEEGVALAKSQIGEGKESLKAADRAIALASTPAEKATAHLCKGDVCAALGSGDPRRLADAEGEYRATLAADAKSSSAEFRLGYTLLREKKDAEGIQHLQAFLAAEPTSVDAPLARKFIANPRHAGLQYAPAFSFTSVKGATIDNASLEGKIVVLDFWATWCPPCRESVPEIKELSKKYGPDRVRVVSISADEKENAWRDFIARKNMDWDQYRDADGSVRKAFGVRAFPTYIVLDNDGAIVQRMTGLDPQDSLAHRLRDELNRLVK